MKKIFTTFRCNVTVFIGLFLILLASGAYASISGLGGTNFTLRATTGHIVTPDGGSYLIWGYANGGGLAQYPGPTLIVNEGDTITITLTNDLTVAGGGPPPNASIVFPGQQVTVVPADPGVPGALTHEATPGGGTVTYEFMAANAGTFTYYSGTDTALQVEMGLMGAIIVRPSAGVDHAYNHPDTQFDREYLFLLSEIDPRIHQVVEFQGPSALAATEYLSNYFPVLWFINGRAAPDTMSPEGVPWLPYQPYNCFPKVHPGEKMLMRVIGAGRDLHPFHHHGAHSRVIARDGRLLESTSGAGPDLSYQVFTIQSVPGETVDAIFSWSGKGLNWDVYGTPADGPEFVHTCVDGNGDDFDDTTHEYCPDHYKSFPIVLPEKLDLSFWRILQR